MTREGYVELSIPADADPDALLTRFIESIQEDIPGWEPADGDIIVRTGDGTGEMAADREALAIDVSRELFRIIGVELFGVQPVEATPATGVTTWTFNDVASHTVEAGVQLTIDGVGFEVTETTTGTSPLGDVPVAALTEGDAGSGLAGTTIEVLDAEALLFTTSVTLDDPTTGGRDEEAQDVYESRLSARIAHLGRPVLPADFSDRARDITGVYRALTIDNFKPGPPWDVDAEDDEAERTVTVVPVDDTGQDVPDATRTELDAYLQAERELNFVVFVIDPTRTEIDVEATIELWPGYTAADVIAEAEQATEDFLDPATWGMPPRGDIPEWHDTTVVDIGSVEAAIRSATGVKRVVTVEINAGTVDITMTGPAPLPTVGTITITEA